MAAAFVAGVNAGGDATTVTTGAIDTTGANLIVVGVTWYAGGGVTTVPPTDSKGNTWTALTARSAAAGIAEQLFYCYTPTVGSGHTFTAATTNTFPVIKVLAFSGADTSPFDVENGATANTTSLQPGSVTPSTADNIVVCSIGDGGTTGTLAINGGFTEPNAEADGAAFSASIGYLIQTAATAQNPTWSGLVGGFGNAAAIAVFKATAGGGGGTDSGPVIGGRLIRPNLIGGKLAL